VLFYLATPPSLFEPIIERIGSVGLLDESAEAWRRVIIEKPFGRDLESARALNRRILTVLQESQIYRIDHYLGKETVQPREGISLQFEAKVPGPRVQLGTVKMDFCYADYFGQSPSTGYETLLYDCMVGDATLFHRADIVEAGWKIVAPVLDAWQVGAAPVSEYAAGSWGPADADALLVRDGRAWHDPLA